MILCGCFSAPGALYAQIVFVDQEAPGLDQDGTSWCTAFKDLQDALTIELLAGTEIRVAEGTYRPTAGIVRSETFKLKSGVSLLGGFAGYGAVDPDLRDRVNLPTVLSGDLLGDDDPMPTSSCCTASLGPGCDDPGCQAAVIVERSSCLTTWDQVCATWARILCPAACGNKSDNSLHVVTAFGADETAIVDGFTITGGFADDFVVSAGERGAGILNYFITSAPTFVNCTIRGNVAAGKGGGVYNNNTSATYTNCLFAGNVAKEGAAVANFSRDENLTFINCTVAGNMAAFNHGGFWNANSVVTDVITLRNCLLWGNVDSGGVNESPQFSVTDAQLVIEYSTIQGWTGLFGGTGNNGFDPLFRDAMGIDGLFGTSDDDFTLTPGSPAINTGDPGTEVADGAADLNQQPRLVGCRVDRGAFESGEAQDAFDFDADGAVSLADFAHLQICFDAALFAPARQAVCLCVFDADASDTIDLDDFKAFDAFLIGP